MKAREEIRLGSQGIMLMKGHELRRVSGDGNSGRRGQVRGCAEHYLGVTDINREREWHEIRSSGFMADEGGEAVNVRRE